VPGLLVILDEFGGELLHQVGQFHRDDELVDGLLPTSRSVSRYCSSIVLSSIFLRVLEDRIQRLGETLGFKQL